MKNLNDDVYEIVKPLGFFALYGAQNDTLPMSS
jgi:hypothetical protein